MIANNTEDDALARRGRLGEVEGAEVSSEWAVDLDESNVAASVVGRLDPLSRGDDIEAIPSLDSRGLDRVTAVVADVALDLVGGTISVSMVVDDVSSSDKKIRANQPTGADHPNGAASSSIIEPGLDHIS